MIFTFKPQNYYIWYLRKQRVDTDYLEHILIKKIF